MAESTTNTDTETDVKKEFEILKVFDKIVIKHIDRLLERNENDKVESSISFNISTIACLLLIVERENEFRSFPESPPQRYVEQSFYEDISDIGLEITDDLKASFNSLVKNGYISVDSKDEFHAQLSSFATVNYLDNLFPGMPGMSFIAYILQIISEIISHRKSLEDAISQVDQTLESRGVSVSKQKSEEEKEDVGKTTVVSKEVVKKRNKEQKARAKSYLKKLSSLRGTAHAPTILTSRGYTNEAEIKPLFDKKAQPLFGKKESQDNKENISAEQENKTDSNVQGPPPPHPEQQAAPPQQAPQDAAPQSQEAQPAAEVKQPETPPIDPSLDQVPLQPTQEPIKDEIIESQVAAAAQEFNKEPTEETDVEKMIEAFQSALDLPCPICNTGKIKTGETAKGKSYFSCSNSICNFISWDKPHHFYCPLCKNPYLIETKNNEGSIGLKCPRAICGYQQDHIENPLHAMQKQSPASASSASAAGATTATKPKKKRKRVVRRVVRKKK